MLPDWWPSNPYPPDIFTMKRERYTEIIPDPDLRTAVSGLLGNIFWNIASEMIYDAFRANFGWISVKDSTPEYKWYPCLDISRSFDVFMARPKEDGQWYTARGLRASVSHYFDLPEFK